MKPKNKSAIVIGLGILVISVAIVYAISNHFNIFTTEEELVNNDQILVKQLKNEVTQELKEFKMKKLIKRRDLILRKENFTQVSNYQQYITPMDDTVRSYVNNNNIDTRIKAYKKAVSWIWVSDQILHNKLELWLKPKAFILDTPKMQTNPQKGSMVSDCESQAYTLVSILEAIGVSKTDVRVVIGEVNFSGEIGGHAWVQIYENNDWIELEATSGPFWDEEEIPPKLVENKGFSYDYFKTHPYPVEEYWAFFNDNYFYNPDNGKQSNYLPEHWKINN